MAYNSQIQDMASRMTSSTRKIIEAIENIKTDIAYNTSQNLLTAENSETDLFNGITGADLQGVITSIQALDGFLTAGWHYTNLNKLR